MRDACDGCTNLASPWERAAVRTYARSVPPFQWQQMGYREPSLVLTTPFPNMGNFVRQEPRDNMPCCAPDLSVA